MRTFLIFAIVAASAGSFAQSPNQGSPAHQQAITQQAAPNPSPVTVVIENGQRGEPKEPTKPQAPEGNTAPEWALVIVGIITCLAIGLQALESHGATQAMRDSLPLQKKTADAALLNAQAVINSERPWVIVQIKESLRDKSDEGQKSLRLFHLSIFNYGKNPAHITACMGPKIEFPVDCDKLSIPPLYETWEWEKRFLAPKDSFVIGSIIDPSAVRVKTIIKHATEGEKTEKGDLVVYGMIEYRDGVSQTPYRTAFCYRHDKYVPDAFGGRLGGHLVLCGPSIYNEYT